MVGHTVPYDVPGGKRVGQIFRRDVLSLGQIFLSDVLTLGHEI